MKKTNKFLLAALVCGAFATSAVAQVYVGAHAGYSFSTAPSVLGTASNSNTSASPATNSTANIYGSNGAGVNFGINAGMMFSEHFGIDLGFDYLSISPQKTETSNSTGAASNNVSSYTTSGTQIRVTPSFVVAAGKEGLKPYARFGVVLPVAGSTITDVSSVTTIPSISKTYTTTVKSETTGQFSLGFNSAVGINFALGEKLNLFGEVALTTLSIKAAKTTYKAFNSEDLLGTTTLADLKTIDKETVYVDELNTSSNNSNYNSTVNQDKPLDDLAKTANYNTLGINVGVKYSF